MTEAPVPPPPDGIPPSDPGTERHLDALLNELRDAPPAPERPELLTGQIMRRARWQRLFHQPSRDAGSMAGAFLDALRLLGRRRPSDRPASSSPHRSPSDLDPPNPGAPS